MKKIRIERLRLWAAVEYFAGYEFPVWHHGKWKTAAQYKLDVWLEKLGAVV